MRDSWDARLDRVKALAEADETARPLLLVYGDLLNLQREGFETIWQRANRLSGSLARDIAMVKECAAMMLNAVARIGPPILAEQARRWVSQGDAAVESMLWTHWRTPASRQFFGRLIVQPYAQCLALAGVSPVDRELTLADNLCPFCGGAPQVSIRAATSQAPDGTRYLECATCSSTWPFRAPLCPHCGEADTRRLGYFHSEWQDHIRVDTCDSCQRYLKSIDLTVSESAVPIVDEVAAPGLDSWARDHGYVKIEPNLVEL